LQRVFWFAGAVVALGAQQAVPPEEIRLSSTEYFPRSQYTLRAESNLVEVGVVVRDTRGHSAGGFRREDFEIEDSGKTRAITAFGETTSTPPAGAALAAATPTATASASQGVPPPAPQAAPKPVRFIGLFFDNFSVGASDMPQAKAAAKRFLKEGIAEGDRVAVFSMSKPLVLPFTTDLARLNAAIDGLNISPRGGSADSCPVLTPLDAYLIANKLDQNGLEVKAEEAFSCGACAQPLRGRAPSAAQVKQCEDRIVIPLAEGVWEQVRDTSARTLSTLDGIVGYMAGLPGKRVLLMVSSGFLANTLERDQDDLTTHALHAEVVIHALDAKGLYTNDFIETTRGAGPRSFTRMLLLGTEAQSTGNNPLSFLAAATGGLFFHNNNDIDLGFRELGLVPEVSYSLGFPPEDPPDNKYHRLKVRLKKAGPYSVEARSGYYSTVSKTPAAAAIRRLDQEVLTTEARDEAPAHIAASPAKTAGGEPAVRVAVRLDIDRLEFAATNGVRGQKITFVAALFDDQSNFVAGKEGELEFALQPATYERLKPGWEGGLTLTAPAGKYRLRAVVEEGVGGKLTATTQSVVLK
jgi:VWFA-related protein